MGPRADRKGGDEQDHDDSAVGLTYQWWLYGCERLCKTVMSPPLRYHLCVCVHVSPYIHGGLVCRGVKRAALTHAGEADREGARLEAPPFSCRVQRCRAGCPGTVCGEQDGNQGS